MMQILYVALGSAFGGVCRYGLSQLIGRFFSGLFPLGTFAVNMVGCFLIGLLYGWIDRGCGIGDGMRLFAVVGFCGGFTTFSTFAHENYLLFGGGRGLLIVAVYAALSFFIGLIMVYFGHRISNL